MLQARDTARACRRRTSTWCVRRFEASERHDNETALSFYDPRVEIESSFLGRTYRGLDGVRAFWRDWLGAMAVDGCRHQHPGPPIWAAGYYGNARPLRRAIRYQGFFPVGLEHPDQLAEISAELRRLGRETCDDSVKPFDIAVELDPGTDPAPYATAGGTWGLVAFPWNPVSVDQVRGVIHDGPPPTPKRSSNPRA